MRVSHLVACFLMIFSVSSYAMADVYVLNQLPDSDSVSLNGSALVSGDSKTVGLNLFSPQIQLDVCRDDSLCKEFIIKDSHEECSSIAWYSLLGDPAWYLDLYLNDTRVGRLCVVKHDTLFLYANMTLNSVSSTDHSIALTFFDSAGAESHQFVW